MEKGNNELTKKGADEMAKLRVEDRKEIIDAITFAQIKALGIPDVITDYKDKMYQVFTNNAEDAKKIQDAVNPIADNFAKHALGAFEVDSIPQKKTA